jgi:hypothetical protein
MSIKYGRSLVGVGNAVHPGYVDGDGFSLKQFALGGAVVAKEGALDGVLAIVWGWVFGGGFFPFCLLNFAFTFTFFLVVEALGDFFGVALVVEGKQAIEDFAAGGFADGEAEALFGVVEVVVETLTPGPSPWGTGRNSIGPAVSGGDGGVHLDVEVAEGLDVGVGAGGIVEASCRFW